MTGHFSGLKGARLAFEIKDCETPWAVAPLDRF